MDRPAIQERFGIIGSSAGLQQALDRLRQVARTDITVLLEGESGVGKELFAQALHEMSDRRHQQHVVVNCGAIPEGLIESELFGAEKGAYTGAVERRTGYFEQADGGTIFLDEIGEMPAAAQVRLLRVLENGTFSRVGSSTILRTDARIIAATNKDLGREVEAGRFREDLYYRLSTVILRIPPLRERREDVLPIFEQYLHRFQQQYNIPSRRLSDAAREMLLRYRWPGNVRELRNVAEQAVVLVRGDTILPEHLQNFLRGVTASSGGGGLVPIRQGQGSDDPETREREIIYRALLELRMELRELKEQIGTLVKGGGLTLGREVPAREEPGRLVIIRDADRDMFNSLIEDVPYELEPDADERHADERHADGRHADGRHADGRHADERDDPLEDLLVAYEEAEGTDGGTAPLPTLEDAERHLISEALKRFEGNRRQTARALGISERTLYRKLKDLEAEL